MVVRGLVKGGIHNTAASLGGAILGVAALTPSGIAGTAKRTVTRAAGAFIPSGKKEKSRPDPDSDPNPSPRTPPVRGKPRLRVVPKHAE